METASPLAPETAHLDRPHVRRAFATMKTLITVYGALGGVVLATVVVLALTGHPVTSFLWGRSAAVLASAAVVYWLTVRASRGARWAYVRVRVIAIVMPIAIVGIDLIPGICPPWFAVAQAICALPVVAIAFLVNGPGPRAAFAAPR
ncbi:hypothetical protein [Streptomyces sp. NPDC003077]|uniref:hypothetical protein n=1 Tax=Streptomyces sp. NPDC003077 TaxID=3154443 RepID=UPI0033A64473